jgi:hypothetical protein
VQSSRFLRLGLAGPTCGLSGRGGRAQATEADLFEPAEGGTKAIFDFRPRVEKPGVKQLSPILKPLFRWNHRRAMTLGERGVNTLFDRRRATA